MGRWERAATPRVALSVCVPAATGWMRLAPSASVSLFVLYKNMFVVYKNMFVLYKNLFVLYKNKFCLERHADGAKIPGRKEGEATGS